MTGRRPIVALALLAAGCGGQGAASSTGTIPAALLREARPVGRGPRFMPPVSGPIAGRCLPRLGARHGVHIEVFAADRVVLIPAGIGTRPPLVRSEGRIAGARCYGALVTRDPTGVVLVRANTKLTVAALFRSWGQPLTSTRLGPFEGGHVSVFVDGRRWHGAPANVALTPHAEIVLEIGPHVPPHTSFTFPPGT